MKFTKRKYSIQNKENYDEIKRLKKLIEDNGKVIQETLEENISLNEQNVILRNLDGEKESTEREE